MEIVQKSGSNKAVYNFLDDKLKYSIKDSSGKNTFSIDYGSIPYEDFSEIEQKNAWYRNVGILWCLLGLVITSMRFFEDGVLSVSMWVSIGFVCLLVYWFYKNLVHNYQYGIWPYICYSGQKA